MSKSKQRPDLGQTVRITAIGKKHRQTNPDNGLTVSHWISEPVEFFPLRGIYIGYRTVSDYDMISNWDYDYPRNINHREAWLIVISERKNPVYVFPEDVQVKCPQCGGRGWYDIAITHLNGVDHDTEDCTFCDKGFITFDKYLAYSAEYDEMIDNFDLDDIPF